MSNASAADEYIFDEACESDVLRKPFISKTMQVIYDSNNGVYNNQILFSTGMLNGVGKWTDFQNSYIEIPFTMAFYGTSAAGATYTDVTNPNQFIMGLKNSSLQLIDSLILQYNGTSVIQNSIFTNVIQQFKILASWTQEDLTKWGAATVTSVDSTDSFHFSNVTASTFGDGTSNNSIAPIVATPTTIASTNYSYNKGFMERLLVTGLNPNGAVNGLQTENAASSAFIAKNFYGTTVVGGGPTVHYWQVMLTLRCKDLSDFFDKIPLMMSGRIDLTINFNTFGGKVSCTQASAAADTQLQTTQWNQLAGHCCPFMIAAGAVVGGAAASSAIHA